jgi:Family of unknown function (DUF6130)
VPSQNRARGAAVWPLRRGRRSARYKPLRDALEARSCKVNLGSHVGATVLTPRRFQAGLSGSFRSGDQKVRTQTIMLIKTLAAVAVGTVLATNAFAQSTREVRVASPYAAIENEPPPKLIVDPTPLAAGLAHGIVWIQYRVENVHIVPVFGAGALNISTDRASARTPRRPALGLGRSE